MKTLLTTTALVGAFAFAGVANAGGHSATAGGLDITVGGFIDFQAGFADHDRDQNQGDANFQNDTEIHVKVSGQTDNGLKYGAVIELEADKSQDDQDSSNGNADKTYIFVESSAGRVELGANVGAEETLKVGAENIARATGGIDGDFFEYVDGAVGGSTDSFVITPDLPVQHGLFTDNGNTKESADSASKITYYTPRFSGVQAGISYTPDTGSTGTSFGGFTNNDVTDYEDVIAVGVNYQGEVEGVGIDAGVTYVNGEGESSGVAANDLEDLSAWNAGVALSFEGFSIAGSYGDLGDVQTVGSNSEAEYFTLGAAYETGPYGVSVTYLDSELETGAADNEFTNLSLGADYQLAPGLVPYVEVSFFEFESGVNTANDNDGSVVILGTQLTF